MEEGLYTVSEMAGMFDLSRQTLIYYDKIGLFRPARTTEAGYRLYTPTQIPYLRLICLLRDMDVELKEIGRLVRSHDVDAIAACLADHERDLAARIAELEQTRAVVERRRRFYDDVAQWYRNAGRTRIVHYPARRVVFEPWGVPGPQMTREKLHPALMRAIQRLKGEVETVPAAGWGTMVRREAFGGADVLAGAGSFVTVPEDVDPALVPDAIELPAGEYVCQSRWGMPFHTEGIDALLAWLDEHRLETAGDAFDFCLLDTTSYTAEYLEDFCCMQIRLAL